MHFLSTRFSRVTELLFFMNAFFYQHQILHRENPTLYLIEMIKFRELLLKLLHQLKKKKLLQCTTFEKKKNK